MKKSKIASPVKSLKGLERRYQVELNKLGKALIKSVREQILPILKANNTQTTTDSTATELEVAFNHLRNVYTGPVAQAYAEKTAEDIVNKTDKANLLRFNRSIKSATGVDLGGVITTEGLSNLLALSKSKNKILIKSLPEEYLKSVETIVSNGVVTGQRWEEIAKEITAKTGSANSKLANRIKLIARNEVATMNSQITLKRSKQLGIKKGIYRTAEDDRVRKCHVELDGKEFEIDKGAWSPSCGKFIQPGITDINCIPGSSKLDHTSFCEKIFRRRYSGNIMSFVFSDGTNITATPNHPILTDCGFKAAKLINRFDNIIRTSNESADIWEFYGKDMIPKIEQIFSSFDFPGIKHSVPADVRCNFHGDVSDCNVDIINIDSLLRDKINPSIRKKFAKFSFSRADKILIAGFFTCRSPQNSFLLWDNSSLIRFMGIFDLIMSRMLVHLTPLELFGFTLGSWLDSSLQESFTDNTPGDPIMFSDCIFAFSALVHGIDIFNRKVELQGSRSFRNYKTCLPDFKGNVIGMKSDLSRGFGNGASRFYKLDSVIDIKVSDFSSHVYNLQTFSGYYSIGSTVMSNCRCFYSPVIEIDGEVL